MSKSEEQIETLRVLAEALSKTVLMMECDMIEEAITSLLGIAKLIDDLGPSICQHAIETERLTFEQVKNAMLAGYVLTEVNEGDVEVFRDITPDDFA